MKQLLLHKGNILIENVPAPALGPNQVLVEVEKSLISTGTEMSSVQLSGASLVKKAQSRPKELSKVLHSIKIRGIKRTLGLVTSKLDESKPLGYSCTGSVLATGSNVKGFQKGERVACAGATYANHAEVVSVPSNLVVKVPAGVDSKSASFVTLGSIALQGIRRADVKLGESICVMGLGLIGQLTVQLLKASGCRVIGMDMDARRVELAQENGLDSGVTSASALSKQCDGFTNGMGVDVTLITASTSSSEPTRQAFDITRKKGKIVVVGAVGMNLERSPFYEKEQDFLISCSYGPGRYDSSYENDGIDYPYPYVRWTENRNMSAFLNLIQEKKINVEGLVEAEFEISDAEKAYKLLGEKNGNKPLAIVLGYSSNGHSISKIDNKITHRPMKNIKGPIRLGLIGAGNFVKTTHLPILKKLKKEVVITSVCTGTSASAATLSRQLKVQQSTTDYIQVLNDPEIDAVLVATRHDTHATIVKSALQAGKHIFVEKPLALTMEALNDLNETVQDMSEIPTLMVGYNRRYSPFGELLNTAIKNRTTPLMGLFRVNAGPLSKDHWIQTAQGGGRLKGEACHMVDFFHFLSGSKIKNVFVQGLKSHVRADENFQACFSFEDGSLFSLIYTAQGSPSYEKELVELHWDGQTAIIRDFKELDIIGKKEKTHKGPQNKGHEACLQTFIKSIKSGLSFPIPWSSLYQTTQAVIECDMELAANTLS